MASIKDVAREAGVGVGTVSRAMNGTGYVAQETRKKIEQAVKKLNYTPNELARNLFRNRTGIIGVIVPDLDHPFFSCLVKHIEMELYRQGYKTMVCNTVGVSRRELEYLDMLDRNIVDGIITGSHCLDGAEYLKRDKPIVSIDRDFGAKIPIVGSDHARGGELAARLLLENGCRRVIQISGIAPSVLAKERHTVFESILKSEGAEVYNASMDWNTFAWEAYCKKAEQVFREYERADGVFSGDLGAIACMKAALQRGRKVPQDFQVIGFDGTSAVKMAVPELTAVRQKIDLLAEVSVNTLLDLVEQRKQVPHRQILEVELSKGGTTL